MTKRELAQERPQRRRCPDALEHAVHAAVAQQVHVLDRVRASDHPCHKRQQLQPRVRALATWHRQMLIGQLAQTSAGRQRGDRDKPRARHEIRLVEHRRANRDDMR